MKKITLIRLLVIAVILAIGLGVSYAGGIGGAQIGGASVFVLCGVWAFAVNWLVFVPSNIAQSEKYYDFTGSVTYLSVIGIAIYLVPEVSLRAKIAALMVAVWAIRLGTFLFIRISKDGHDDRFDEIKINPLRFFIAWTIQGLWAILTAACALAIITNGSDVDIGLIGSIGIIVWLIGFIIEVVADAQKRAFRRDESKKGKFINVGLWSWSRHPNYFGEITLWVGMAILAFPVLSGLQYVTLISPVFVILLLTRVSGIPLLAKKGLERWGDDVDYQAYLKTTSLLVPIPPKKQ